MPATEGSTSDQDRPDLAGRRRIHVIGAAGSGMSAIATVLAQMGHAVTGSDAGSGPTFDQLAAAGVDVRSGHDPRRIDGAEIIVRSTAIADDNPEVQAAASAGMRVWRRADMLAAICARKRTIAISGTHGKTTTSSMATVALRHLGWAPSMIVGGHIAGEDSGGRWDPAGEWMVVEADESDGTFVELGAEAVVVTSLEADHLEFYGGMERLRAAFARFVAEAPGPAVLCADDAGSRSLAGTERRGPAPFLYGTSSDSDVRISDVHLARSAATFTIAAGGRLPASGRTDARIQVPGLHNVRNATAVVTLLVALGAPWPDAVAAVGSFKGVGRRFEVKAEVGGITFIDDYSHLPTEVEAAIAAARTGGWDRVVAVFQPHRYSRTEALGATFADAFTGADVLVLCGLYAAGEAPRPGVTGRLVADAVSAAHPEQEQYYAETLDEAAGLLAGLLRPGDACLTLGAGDVTTLTDRVRARIEGGAG